MRMKVQRRLHDFLLNPAYPQESDRPAVIADGRTYTHAQLTQQAQRLARFLRNVGVERGDRVAILLENSWASAVSIYGILIAGGVFVPINPQTKTDKLSFILTDSGASVLIVEHGLDHIVAPALDKLAHPLTLLCVGTTDPHSHLQFTVEIERAEPLLEAAPTIPLDLAALIYTSGSTGDPKGVMQTHQSMVFTLGSLIEYLGLNRDDRVFCTLPLSFDYGLYQLLMTVALGACLVLERSFTFLGHVLNRLEETRSTIFPGVPTQFASLVAAHRRSPICLPHITRVTNTAAALPDEFTALLRELFPNALIYKMYGLTECKRVSYLPPDMIDAKPGSVGKAIPGTEVYLLDPAGKPTLPGEIGTLYVRGPHIMAGYWNQPKLTRHMLKPGKIPGERVLCTHDLFRIDNDGFLYFVSRTDDIIKTRGEKVSPVEIENVLHRISGVLEAAVIGIPNQHSGEAIRAYVVIDSASDLTPQSIRLMSATLLESHMVPREVLICERLPRSPNGKIDKRALSRDPLDSSTHHATHPSK